MREVRGDRKSNPRCDAAAPSSKADCTTLSIPARERLAAATAGIRASDFPGAGAFRQALLRRLDGVQERSFAATIELSVISPNRARRNLSALVLLHEIDEAAKLSNEPGNNYRDRMTHSILATAGEPRRGAVYAKAFDDARGAVRSRLSAMPLADLESWLTANGKRYQNGEYLALLNLAWDRRRGPERELALRLLREGSQAVLTPNTPIGNSFRDFMDQLTVLRPALLANFMNRLLTAKDGVSQSRAATIITKLAFPAYNREHTFSEQKVLARCPRLHERVLQRRLDRNEA